MKELDFRAGEHISTACARLAAEAPAWVEFNGVRIEAHPGDAAGDLEARWTAEMNRRSEAWLASPAYARQEAERARQRAAEQLIQAESMREVAASGVREKYPWTDAMGEISGFGGGYEQACRDMVYAGLAWIQRRGGKVDLSSRETSDAVALDKELNAACPDCSGAMHGATMNAVAFIAKQGWDEYVRRMTERTAAEQRT